MYESWMLKGRCSGLEGADRLFFPSGSKTLDRARNLCESCPVSAECFLWSLGYSMRTGERVSDPIPEGIFAGLTPKERV